MIKKLLVISILILALCTLAGLLVPLHPLFDLFNNFRLQAVIAGILLSLIVWRWSRKAAFISLLIAVFNSGLIAFHLQQSRMESMDTKGVLAPAVTVISANVLALNEKYERAMRMIETEKPDIAVFLETTPEWVAYMESLEKDYPYTLKHPREDYFGITVYAKQPFEFEVVESGTYRMPIAILRFNNFTLIAAHPIQPVSLTNMNENRQYLRDVAAITAAENRPVMVAGDLNATLWSDALTPLLDAGLKRANPVGFAYTWPSYFPPLAIQIDHFLLRGLKPENFRVLEEIGSDHYPIKVTVRPIEIQPGNPN